MYNFSVAPPGESIFASPGYKKSQGMKTTPNNTSHKSASSQPRSRNQSSNNIYRLAKHGKIQVICGPMFSGKSTELLRQMRVFEVAHHRSLLIKYSKDNRYSEKPVVSTHDKVMRKAVSSGKKLTLLNKIAVKFTVIGIDEGQFFEDIVEFAEEMANRGKTVIVAALDGTWEQKPFHNIANLMPKCESIVKLTSVCMACLKPGTFTRRLDANDTRLEVIGDTDMYSAFKKWCLVGRNLVILEHFHNNFRLKRKLPEIEMFAFGFSARPSSCLYRQTLKLSTEFGRKSFWKCPKITKLRQSDAKI